MKKFDDIRFQDLQEGLYDPNIFKAFFLAGGPGSGKTFVTRNAFGGTGLRQINSDSAFENALRKNGLSLKMPEDEAEARDILRARAKGMTDTQLDMSLKGRLGLVIDGTGRDYDKIKNQKAILDQLGYDCYMIFVNTSLDVALERNKKRERSVPEYITRKSHTIVGTRIDPHSWDEKAFIEGIEFSASTNNILNQLFAVRAKGLFNQLTTATAGAFLSGLLIGHELGAALAGARFRKVYLIGHGRLTNLYHTTLLEKGFDPKILTPDIIANGHFKLMKTIERNVS